MSDAYEGWSLKGLSGGAGGGAGGDEEWDTFRGILAVVLDVLIEWLAFFIKTTLFLAFQVAVQSFFEMENERNVAFLRMHYKHMSPVQEREGYYYCYYYSSSDEESESQSENENENGGAEEECQAEVEVSEESAGPANNDLCSPVPPKVQVLNEEITIYEVPDFLHGICFLQPITLVVKESPVCACENASDEPGGTAEAVDQEEEEDDEEGGGPKKHPDSVDHNLP